MGQTVIFAVGGGILSAMLFLSAAFGSPGALITTFLTPLPLFLVGLSLGSAACIVAGIVSALGVALVLGPANMVLFAAGGAIPIALIVHQTVTVRQDKHGVPQWLPPGSLVLWLVGFAAMGIAAAATVAAATGAGLQIEILASLTEHMAKLDVMTGGDGAWFVDRFTRFGPAVVAGVWMLLAVTNAALAQWFVGHFDLAVRPRIEMAEIELPIWPLPVLGILTMAAFTVDGQVGYVAQNLALVIAAAFFLAGLGVVHAVLRGRGSRPLLLIVFYTAIFWQGAVVLPAVAGLGMIEKWAGLRRRMATTALDLEDK